MSEKKDIDRLFQEKFKDFEQSPSPEMWNRIEQELNKDKKKRRVIPIWWRVGGVAAMLLLFLTAGINWLTSSGTSNTSTPVIVDTENSATPKEDSESPDSTFDINTDTTSPKVAVEETNTSQPNGPEASNSGLDVSSEKQNVTKIEKGSSKSITNGESKTTLVASQEYNTPDNGSSYSVDSKEPSEASINTDVLQNGLVTSDEVIITAALKPEEAQKEDIIEKEELTQSQTIEEAIAEAEALKDAPVAKEALPQRWSVSPVVAPVYSMALGEGSTIHSQFNENSKSSDVTVSYGVGASYAVSNRLKVRAGLNRVDFTNTTNEVMAFNSVVNSLEPPSELALATVVLNADSNVYLMSASPLLKGASANSMANMEEDLGQLVLDYGYVELPVALEYRVLDKKFGVNLVGGFSTFFLNNNQVSTIFSGEREVIGQSSNLNSTSYSANFGIGFDYGITKQLNVMLEPTLKYQFNTFNGTCGNVQPMFIGVYTGLNFKF